MSSYEQVVRQGLFHLMLLGSNPQSRAAESSESLIFIVEGGPW